jgi:hypothetical protein
MPDNLLCKALHKELYGMIIWVSPQKKQKQKRPHCLPIQWHLLDRLRLGIGIAAGAHACHHEDLRLMYFPGLWIGDRNGTVSPA